jgi:hypothetical protein
MRTGPPDMPARKRVELISRQNLSELAVTSEAKLQGIFSRAPGLAILADLFRIGGVAGYDGLDLVREYLRGSRI